MCGIVGLYLKDDALRPELGRRLTAMLVEMTDRGPDSAGVAVYRNGVPEGWSKLTLFHPGPTYDWTGLEQGLAATLETRCHGLRRASHFVLTTAAPAEAARRWIGEHHADVRVMSVGESIEIYKEKGLPKDVAARFELETITGSHAIGHTRMATESAVTTEHSHPFSTGRDLCLVHNGSLSNHNRLRAWLRRRGIEILCLPFIPSAPATEANCNNRRTRTGGSCRPPLVENPRISAADRVKRRDSPLPGATQDHQLMLDQQCLRNDGSRPTRSQQSGQGRQKMQEEHQKVAHGLQSYRHQLGLQVYEMRAICSEIIGIRQAQHSRSSPDRIIGRDRHMVSKFRKTLMKDPISPRYFLHVDSPSQINP